MTTNYLVRSYQNSIGDYWYKRLGLAALLILVAYGLASWAINNGSLLLYVITIVLTYFAIGNIVKAVRLILYRNGR
jgi:hypothetical protein